MARKRSVRESRLVLTRGLATQSLVSAPRYGRETWWRFSVNLYATLSALRHPLGPIIGPVLEYRGPPPGYVVGIWNLSTSLISLFLSFSRPRESRRWRRRAVVESKARREVVERPSFLGVGG